MPVEIMPIAIPPVEIMPVEIGRLVPHAGAMCLNQHLAAWDDARVVLLATSHRDPGNPLRRDGRLHALHLGEYGAQAMAVHGGLLAARDGSTAPPGLLVSLRGLELAREWIEDLPDALRIEAERLAGSDVSWQYAFRITHRDAWVATGRAAVMARAVGAP